MRRLLHVSASRHGFLLLIFFCLQLTPLIPVFAKTGIAETTEDLNSEKVTPPAMAYRPLADADEIREFAPADAEVKNVTSALDVKASTGLDPTKNSLVTIGNEKVGVFVEENSFKEGITLEFTETEAPKVNIGAGEDTQSPGISVTNSISNPVDTLPLVRFQLELVSTSKAEAIPAFETPVRIVLDVRALMKDLNPVYSNFFLAYQDEIDPHVWHDVPVSLYQKEGLFSADVLHFSNWTASVRPERWNPAWSPPAVSEFSGAATYGYPIAVPPGRGGL